MAIQRERMPISRRVFGIILALFVTIFALVVATTIITNTARTIRVRQNQTTHVALQVSELFTRLIDMETSVRGYALTSNPEFLAPYSTAVDRVHELFATLERDVAVIDPILVNDVSELSSVANQWQLEYAEPTIGLVTSGNTAAAQAIEQREQGKNLFDQIRAQEGELSNALLTVDLSLTQQVDDLTFWRSLLTALMLGIVILSVIVAAYVWRREQRVWTELQTASANLATTNTELQQLTLTQQQTNQRLRSRIEESRLINTISDMLASGQPVDQVYPIVAEHIGRLLDGWCSVLLRRPAPNEDTLEILALYHPDAAKLSAIQEWLQQQEIRVDEGLHAPLFTAGDPVVLLQVPPETSRPPDLDPELAPLADLINLTSYIAVPLVVYGNTMGLISVASSTSGHYFEASQELFLTQVADRLGTWLENIRLYQLAEQRATELQTSFDSIVDIIITYDAAGRKLRINKSGRQFLGIDATVADVQGLWRRPNGQMLTHDEHPVQRALRGEIVADLELTMLRHDGQLIVHTVSVSPLQAAKGTVEGAVLVARDISARKELDRLKDEFMANMSHELRTPLTAILGYSELLLKRRTDVLTPWHINKIQGVRTGGHRLLGLVNDLLDIAKLDAGHVELHREEANINTLILEQIELLKPTSHSQNLHFETQLAESVPAFALDPDRMSQVLMNLLGNATKFTPAGGTITVSTELVHINDDMALPAVPTAADGDELILKPDDYVRVRISDTGIGMSDETITHLWERFYQAEGGSTRRFGGTGLGLSIVHQLVELHGGVIWASSAGEDRGSTFTMMLPIVPLLTESALPYHEGGATILVIEDDEATSRIFEQYLNDAGFNVVLARSAQETMELAPQINPAAITLDLLLPDSDGWAILEQLRQLPHLSDTPVVIASIMDTPPVHLGLGVATYLVKPVRGDVLIHIINRLVGEWTPTSSHVLVVDDDVDMAGLLQATLQEHGYATQVAYNGLQAIEMLATGELPSLILLDLMMPIIDGFELLVRLRDNAHTRGVPVIVITARDLLPEELSQLRFAAQGVQTKHNLDLEKLIADVQRHVTEGTAHG